MAQYDYSDAGFDFTELPILSPSLLERPTDEYFLELFLNVIMLARAYIHFLLFCKPIKIDNRVIQTMIRINLCRIDI